MLKYVVAALLAAGAVAGAQQRNTPSTLKAVLLQELRETHNEKNWFVSEKEATTKPSTSIRSTGARR